MPEEKKPFDLKDLEQRLAKSGLKEAEGCAKALIADVFGWAEDGVRASESKVDDLALGVLATARDFLLKKAEGISEE